jgi:hypothetical protein
VPTWDEIVELVDRQTNERLEEEVWVNDLYQVAVRPADDWTNKDGNPICPKMIRLSIECIDRKA